jgi:hypothetical protein
MSTSAATELIRTLARIAVVFGFAARLLVGQAILLDNSLECDTSDMENSG